LSFSRASWDNYELQDTVSDQLEAVAPCHNDPLPDNCSDPKQFRAALKVAAPDVLYQEMIYGEPLLISLA
jgi:hypothetical protein